jgi:hypothetical protein
LLWLLDPGQDIPGREPVLRIREDLEAAIKSQPNLLAPLKLHYLRWLLFRLMAKPRMYQGIFDTEFDKYTEDAVGLLALAA